jgi:hypothetical protein
MGIDPDGVCQRGGDRPVLSSRRFLGRVFIFSTTHRPAWAYRSGGAGNDERSLAVSVHSGSPQNVASIFMLTGAIAMPAVCFLTGWRTVFRHLFAVPVISLITGRGSHSMWRHAMNIGLLAMSGIRAHDAELLRLGLTLPGFVERSKTIASLPSLGLLYLAAVTPPGHRVTYFEAESDGAEPAAVYACDLVAISTFSAQVFEAYSIADRLRAAGVKVAMGGLHVSVRPEEALQHCDYIIIGEGENVWPAVVEAAQNDEPQRTFNARDFAPVDVRDLPIPRYDLLGNRPYNPLHRPDLARLPLAMRFLRFDCDAQPALSHASGRARDSRHPRDPAAS